MWGIVSLSPMIWIKSLLSFVHSNQTRTAHNVFVWVFCGMQDAFLFWSSSSSTIGIILRYVEVFGESVSAPLIFSSANISFKSLWREFCGSDFRSFPVIRKLIRKLIIRKLTRFRYLLWKRIFKSYLSLSMNSMITWKHRPTYWIIEHANKMVKTTEQRNQKQYKANSLEDALKHFSKPCQNKYNFLTFIVFF